MIFALIGLIAVIGCVAQKCLCSSSMPIAAPLPRAARHEDRKANDDSGPRAMLVDGEQLWMTKCGKKIHLCKDCTTFFSHPDRVEICANCQKKYNKKDE